MTAENNTAAKKAKPEGSRPKGLRVRVYKGERVISEYKTQEQVVREAKWWDEWPGGRRAAVFFAPGR